MTDNTGIQTILIAEDDLDDLELIRDAFSELDASFNLHTVQDGRGVLDYLETQPSHALPCLIVLDYNMPLVTGVEVLKTICHDPRYESIPKVILSTSSTPRNIDECLRNGAHAYRIKPSNFAALVDIAQEMLQLCRSAA